MAALIYQRIIQSIFVMLTVSLIAFSLFNYVGDPITNMVGVEATAEEREQLRERLGLNDPFLTQFIHFIGNAIRFDFGMSYRMSSPVAQLIAERLPATIELATVSAIFALVLGVSLGVYTALNRTGWSTRLIMTGSLIGVSLPTFLTGILLIWIFSVQLKILPSFGRGEIVDVAGWPTGLLTKSGLSSLVLPAITLGLFQLTLIMRLVRAEMLEVLRTDYIKFARARGLPNRVVHFGHALKNTLVPVITITGLQLGSIVAFAIVTETVFQWPGVGLLFINAVHFVDIPIMAAYLMFIGLLFVTINLTVDILYFIVDPRLRVNAST